MKVNLSGVSITSREKKYVFDVIKSGILSLGKYLLKFEKLISEFTGRKYAIAVSSGTAGLFLLLKYYDLKKTDEVITTPFSFIASANVFYMPVLLLYLQILMKKHFVYLMNP